jgi:glycosyltransferase involved in cell wall biosynthesis
MNEIEICLATYNGEKYIEEFLISLHEQTFKDFHILVSDDGSTDNTLKILEKFSPILNMTIISNKISRPLGPAKNFLYLLEKSLSPYVMFADQDDVWHKDKIDTCLYKMHEIEGQDSNVPCFVFSDYSVVDENLDVQVVSGLNKEGKNLSITKIINNIEFTNYVPGCTAMVNRTLADLPLVHRGDVLMHEWWLMLLNKYNGGRFGFVNAPLVRYRQHANNVVGIAPESNIIMKGFNFCRTPISRYLGLVKQFQMITAAGYRKNFLSFLLVKVLKALSND